MPTLGEVAQASKIWQVFSLAERDEKFGTISVIAWVSSVLGELSSWHDKRKWLSSPTPSLHYDDLYQTKCTPTPLKKSPMRGGKSDAGGPEKQLILFVWPYGGPFAEGSCCGSRIDIKLC